jgi:hypothetical protein
LSVAAGAGIGVKFGARGRTAGTSGAVPPAGLSSDGGFAALVGDAGVRGGGGAEALCASGIPPGAAIDNKADSTQNFMIFIVPLPTHRRARM